jgi:CcmD family protein
MRFHRFSIALAAALLLAAPLAHGAPAQAASAPATSAATSATTDGSASPAAQPGACSTSTGLPAEPAPPRTLRAYWHVWIAFTLAWLLLFGYVISVGRRFGKLEREVESLGG